ncbi:MAG: DMT family transporter [Pseudomonadota bacterium]
MDFRALLMGLAFVLMWSSAFATARLIVADAPPLLALSARFLISGGIAVAIAATLGQSWRISRSQARSVVIFGLCQNALYLGLNFVAMQTIEASLAVIIAASLPLIVALLDWLVRGQRVAPLGLLGLILGMAGVGLIMGTRVQGGADPWGVVLCIGGATALAVATLSVRGASGGGNLLMIVGLQMLVGSLALGLAGAVLERPVVTWTPSLIAAFAYQILIPGLAATLLWFRLVGRIGATRASTFHFLNPFFGVTIAALLLGESIGPLDVLGVVVVMVGILAVQLSRARAA